MCPSQARCGTDVLLQLIMDPDLADEIAYVSKRGATGTAHGSFRALVVLSACFFMFFQYIGVPSCSGVDP